MFIQELNEIEPRQGDAKVAVGDLIEFPSGIKTRARGKKMNEHTFISL